ncbi:uncharacterized protein LOC117891324 isoform X1 [Drosophila subobscura]|uniref:uncharacterized protein LOC117891324 isoform X1 n=1 Tax=Drosophila subobscura TaxID=7241 RepID=UPI00155A2514|nr:uncharacterized protein LOC117891324 isoform X1 [Drosophila subobscura]
MSHLVMRRWVLLLFLLSAAAPMRSAPLSRAEGKTVPWDLLPEERERLPEEDWEWVQPEATTADPFRFPYLDFVDNGSPSPKRKAAEMANELGDSTMADYFPPFPELMSREWRQRQENYIKQLLVLQKWQSPPRPRAKPKRSPIHWPFDGPTGSQENVEQPPAGEPRYPYAYFWPNGQRPGKRKNQLQMQSLRYMPSISAGAMTNLGNFFNHLEENVRFAEQSQLGESEARLLEGRHPHPLQMKAPLNATDDRVQKQEQDQKTSKLLHAIRTYRPSQKIRSLVSRNPQGYRGSQLIDPSYMWLGLGK